MRHNDIVDEWEIAPAEEGGFNLLDRQGAVAGTFTTRQDALAAAIELTEPEQRDDPDLRDAEPGSGADTI